MIVTQHAMKRMTQRAIKMSDVEIILALGTIQPRPGGAVEYYVNREKISFVIKELKHMMNQVDRLSKKAVLVTNDEIKTVYYKHN